jgi:hypothetical protein
VSERYVKEGFWMGVCLHRGPAGGTWRRDSFTEDFERLVKVGSGGGASLSLYGGSERETPLLGTLKDM